jgi:hypothetical protein
VLEGCFLSQGEWEVDFFLGFDANDLVDVWLIEGIHWTELIESPDEGFWYYPDRVARSKMSLHRRGIKTRDGMHD